MFFFFRLKGIFSPILVIYVMCVWTRRRIMNADLSRELWVIFIFFLIIWEIEIKRCAGLSLLAVITSDSLFASSLKVWRRLNSQVSDYSAEWKFWFWKLRAYALIVVVQSSHDRPWSLCVVAIICQVEINVGGWKQRCRKKTMARRIRFLPTWVPNFP